MHKNNFIITKCYRPNNRLDQVLSKLLNKYSRSRIKKIIISKSVLVNTVIINKPNKKIYLGDKITILFKDKIKKPFQKSISINIIYEDQYILIVNKPNNLVIHPGINNTTGTLLNSILCYYPNLINVPRAGIIHRLDKDTTGLLIIAKDILTYTKLVNLMKRREIIREYDAFVLGHIMCGGMINQPILKVYKNKVRMIVNDAGKVAITHYTVIQKFQYYTHVRIKLKTGRTHQIRVHMLYIKHPILGDKLYKFQNNELKNMNINSLKKIKLFNRQALNASHISFIHPRTNKLINCYIPLPRDMVDIMKFL